MKLIIVSIVLSLIYANVNAFNLEEEDDLNALSHEKKEAKKTDFEERILSKLEEMQNSNDLANLNLFGAVKEESEYIKNELAELVKKENYKVKAELSGQLASEIDVLKLEMKQMIADSQAVCEGMHYARNCYDLQQNGDHGGGVRVIAPWYTDITVRCNQDIDGGGWTVLQSRGVIPLRENFSRSWQEYVDGFGDVSVESWLGLENIRALTNSTVMELRIDLETYDGKKSEAKYESFFVANSDEKYTLTIGDYSGNSGDSLAFHNGSKFSTIDQDNDGCSSCHCAADRSGGWWFSQCHDSNLNGLQNSTDVGIGVNWKTFRPYKESLAKVSMMVRPKFRITYK